MSVISLETGSLSLRSSVGLALRHTQFALCDSATARAIYGAAEKLTIAIAELRDLAQGVRPAYLDDGPT